MSSKDRWQRAEALLDEILALPAADWSEECVRRARGDAELLRELQSLLAHVGGTDAILDYPAAEAAMMDAQPTPGLQSGTSIGAYRVVSLVGRGGMGEVYLAERADGQFEHQAAIKLMRREFVDRSKQFQNERQMLARLDHPNIAHLHDGGVTQEGQPFMVMEFVQGLPITAWCREHASSIEARLQLFIKVCDAVAYAHRNLIVHRDLKPSNVLVSDGGEVKLLDFGVARWLDRDKNDETRLDGLTPIYAAPEQLTGAPITTATDVFALGMLLYELRASANPRSAAAIPLATLVEHAMREDMPAPSKFALQQAQAPSVAKPLSADLDAVIAKALRTAPEQRYESVAALQADVQRALRGEPVAARAGARMYVMSRFARRHWLPIASATALLLAIVVGAAGIEIQAHHTAIEARKTAAVKDFLLNIFRQNSVDNPDGARARQTTAQQLLDNGAGRIRTELRDEPDVRDAVIDTISDLYDELEDYTKVITLRRDELAGLQEREGTAPSAHRATIEAALGRALRVHGDEAESQQQLAHALDDMDAIGDLSSATRAYALIERGRLSEHNGSIADDAEKRDAGQALAILERYHPESPMRMEALQLLSRQAEARGHAEAAEHYYRDLLLTARQPRFARFKTELALAEQDFGSFLTTRQRYSEAEPLLRDAIGLYSQSEGAEAVDTAATQSDLALALLALNRGAEAQSLMTAAVASVARSQGENNIPWTGTQRLRLATLLETRGELLEGLHAADAVLGAILAYEKPLERYEMFTRLLRGRILSDMARYDEARQDLARAQTLVEKFGASGLELGGVTRAALADIATATGQADSALSMLQMPSAKGAESAQYLPKSFVLCQLAKARAQLALKQTEGALGTAQQLLARILAMPNLEFGADWEARAQLSLGEALLAVGQSTEAESHLRRAVDLRAKIDAPDSSWLAQARVVLARCLNILQQPDAAQAILSLTRTAVQRHPELQTVVFQ